MPPAGSRGRVAGQGVRERSPLKLNAFLCCGMPEIAQSCYVDEQGRQSHRIIGGHKRRLGSGGRKSPSGVQGQSPGRKSEGRILPEAEPFFVKLHIIFALKYNKQQLLLLLDKIHLT